MEVLSYLIEALTPFNLALALAAAIRQIPCTVVMPVGTPEVKQAAAVAKLYTSEAAVSATRIATQVFGGNGFMEEYPVARFYRDAKILEIGEGTSEVQRMVIAKGLGLPTS